MDRAGKTIVKVGKHYMIFSMEENGAKYYYVKEIKQGGYKWQCTNIADALYVFDCAEADPYIRLTDEDIKELWDLIDNAEEENNNV